MAEIASWNNHSLVVSPTLIRGFSDLSIEGGSETKDKTSSKQKYVTRKNGNPMEVSLTVGLNVYTGCDVRAEAMKLVDEAFNGEKGYFYLGGKKLVTCKLMLVNAKVVETAIAPNGTWTSCQVKMTMKQCGKSSGIEADSSSDSSSSSSSSGSSSKKTSTKKSTKTTAAKTTSTLGANKTISGMYGKSQLEANAQKAQSALKSAVAAVNSAKKESQNTKTQFQASGGKVLAWDQR